MTTTTTDQETETNMRKYAQNSPQAAARIIGLTLIADGDVGHVELALLDELDVHQQLGLTRDALHAVIDTFCEDLLSSKQLNWADTCPVDEYTLNELMAEIDDPELRRKVLGLCVRLAEADDKVAEGESLVLSAAVAHWSMHHQMLMRWF
ncbi:TerB family tellurite resistance protein [Rhodoferax sp. 4810]|nr:TerB family tellurite resistance protein [Rhodoferax jenense]